MPAGGDSTVQSMLLRVVQSNRVQLYAQSNKSGKCSPGQLLMGRLYFMVFENVFWQQLQREKEALAFKHQSGGQDSQHEPEIDQRMGVASLPSTSSIHKEAEKRMKMSMIQYDLKGSWVNRTTMSRPGEDHKGQTLKDGDLHEKMYLSSHRRSDLMERLRRDTEWLAERQIMDYSLLLGVKKELATLQHEGVNDNEWLPDRVNTAQSYHMGIIDILQTWDTKKMLERYAKALMGKDIGKALRLRASH